METDLAIWMSKELDLYDQSIVDTTQSGRHERH